VNVDIRCNDLINGSPYVYRINSVKGEIIMEKIRVGFIGCGKIAQVRHIPEADRSEDVIIGGYFNRTKAKAEDMAEKYGGKVYDTYQELLEDENIDAVVVSVANILHADVTIEALKKGKHVLCEKPMAMTLEESELMVKTAKEEKKVLNIAHNQRLNAAHQKAKELIEEGAIGKVLTFRTTFGHGGPEEWSSSPGKDVWFFYEDAAGMGAMADLGIHKTDLIEYLTGQKVVEVNAMLGTLDKRGSKGNLITVDDNAICLFRLSGGALGTMTVSWTYYGPEDNSTRIYGSEGILYIYDDPEYPLKIVKKDQEILTFDVGEIQTNENQTGSGVMDVFIEGIRSGEETILSGDVILSAMRAVFACEESFDEGKTITIEENGGNKQ